MKKITAVLLSFLIICSCFAGCKEEKKVDSFLIGGIWEAVLKSSDTSGQVIAYKFKDDGTFLFYQNLIITAGGYFEHDEEKEELILTNADSSQKLEISCKYSDDGILTLNGPLVLADDSSRKDAEINFKRLSSEDEAYYKENATTSYVIEKQE